MPPATAKTPSRKKAPPQGIDKVLVAGFKSLRRQQEVEVRPLTILAGANSSGKSSIMQPLLLLKQTLEASYDPGPLLLNGPIVRFTSADQLLSRTGKGNPATTFRVGVSVGTQGSVICHFKKQKQGGFELPEMVHILDGQTVRFHDQMSPDEIREAAILFNRYLGRLFSAREEKEFVEQEWIVERERCFLGVGLAGTGSGLTWWGPGEFISPYLKAVIHVPGLRGNPERTYPVAAVGTNFPGTFEAYTASVISQWQAKKDNAVDALGEDLRKLGLTWKVTARPINDTQVELQVGRLPSASRGGAWDLVNIADVGFGVSQTLPVLVALRVARPGQLVYLEQPEIHLHPRAQVALAEVLTDAARRGVRVVAESHSGLLLLGVQTLVAEDRLDPALVKLHWFQRRDDGSTDIRSTDLDEAGAFGDWPEDFGEVSLHAEHRYLTAAEKSQK